MADIPDVNMSEEKMSSSLPKDCKLSPELLHQGFSQDNKHSDLVSHPVTHLSFPKTSPTGIFPTNSPFTLRSRKVTSPSSNSFSFLSASDQVSSLTNSKLSDSLSDISRDTTPLSTPVLGRKIMNFNNFETDRFPPPPSSTMSRSSSTLSLCSNVSQATSGLPPLDRLLKHLREKLSGALFSGWYTERRYVDAIGRYKDIVLVDSVEHLVIKQVKYAIRKCGKILAPNSYIGLTLVEEECKIFTNLATVVTTSTVEASHPFGHYWFQVRSINFLPNVGFTMEIVVVRQFVSADSQTCWKCKSLDTQPDTTPQVKIDSIGAAVSDMKNRLCHLLSELCTEVWQPSTYWEKLRPLLTVSTMVQACKLVLVLLLAMITGMVAGVKQLAQFSLRLLHELANLVDRSTPLALGALNIVSKVVGGAYLLVAMIWRDTVKKPVGPPPPRPALTSLPPLRASLPPPPPPGLERLNSPHKPEYRGAMDSMYSQGRNW